MVDVNYETLGRFQPCCPNADQLDKYLEPSALSFGMYVFMFPFFIVGCCFVFFGLIRFVHIWIYSINTMDQPSVVLRRLIMEHVC